MYINSGSTINLTCQVMESPVPPDYVFWYHNGKVINYDSPRGISVHTETAQRTTSKLLISNAQPSDSGNYSCVPSNAEPAAIGLHVLNGTYWLSNQIFIYLSAYRYTQRNELIKTTKRVLLSIFLVLYAKFLVEVRKWFCYE